MSLEITGIANNGLVGIPSQGTYRQVIHPAHTRTDGEQVLADQERIKNYVKEIEKFGGFFHRRLQFSINKELEQIVVKVIDTETDKVIKVLPPEELQRLHLRIREAIGLLFDEKI